MIQTLIIGSILKMPLSISDKAEFFLQKPIKKTIFRVMSGQIIFLGIEIGPATNQYIIIAKTRIVSLGGTLRRSPNRLDVRIVN